MPINSKQKGARGEREIAKIMRSYGYADAIRSEQYCGANGDADVIGVDGLHIEVKRVEKLALDKWMKQAIEDARSGEIPVVMHRKNNDFWKVTMKLDDFMKLWQVYEKK